MVEEVLTIEDAEGLHARPASEFAKKAMNYKCDVKITANDKTVSGKSIIAIMSLGLKQGSSITITCDGEDSEEALKELVGIIKNN